jgi:hypothetical protein
MKTTPVAYVVFDVLYIDGRDVRQRPYSERRALLEMKLKTTPSLQLSPAIPHDGITLFEAARKQGLEGIVAKRIDSVYETGRRSKAWLKVKTTFDADIVIAGWSEGGGGTNGQLGSIATAVYEGDTLRYTRSVGTGFTDKTRRSVREELERLATDECPFGPETLKGKNELRRAHWVRPELVAMIEGPAGVHLRRAAQGGRALGTGPLVPHTQHDLVDRLVRGLIRGVHPQTDAVRFVDQLVELLDRMLDGVPLARPLPVGGRSATDLSGGDGFRRRAKHHDVERPVANHRDVLRHPMTHHDVAVHRGETVLEE